MGRRAPWREYHFNSRQELAELQAAWASHWRDFPGKEMRFEHNAVLAITNCSLEDMRRIHQLSFMRKPLPDYITLKGHPDEEQEEVEDNGSK